MSNSCDSQVASGDLENCLKWLAEATKSGRKFLTLKNKFIGVNPDWGKSRCIREISGKWLPAEPRSNPLLKIIDKF